jgi:hypothetical protein
MGPVKIATLVTAFITLSSNSIFAEVEHPRCVASEDGAITYEVKRVAALERHSGSHGDVCRNPVTRGFFCPAGCEHTDIMPYCAEEVCGSKMPCRVEKMEVDSSKAKVLAMWPKTNAWMEPHTDGKEVLKIGEDCFPACSRSMEDSNDTCCRSFCGAAGACCKKGAPDSLQSEQCSFGELGCAHIHCCVRAHY